jgi:hypothetical protein
MFVKVSANRATPSRHVQKHLGLDHVLMMSLVPVPSKDFHAARGTTAQPMSCDFGPAWPEAQVVLELTSEPVGWHGLAREKRQQPDSGLKPRRACLPWP